MIRRASPNHQPRPAGVPVDTLVLHYTGMGSAEEALARLCDPAAEVSAHYLIDENGTIHQLVEEDRRAWHAGISHWRGHSDINSRSIGIELVNPGHAFGYRPFPAGQMAALTELALGILGRHPVPPRNVVGHSDVAPLRKQDPGELFDWPALARHGIGLWPAAETDPPPAVPVARLLARWGYGTGDGADDGAGTRAALVAFQRHFRPVRIDGAADDETLARLATLLRMVGEEVS
jgi:N-acetylmuramoyl-L-alanine amidase